jgi:hypothetical protein
MLKGKVTSYCLTWCYWHEPCNGDAIHLPASVRFQEPTATEAVRLAP